MPHKLLAGLAFGLALLAGPVAAQEFLGPNLRPLIGAGITVGGDKIVSDIEYDDGVSEDVQAGQLYQLYVGLRYQGVSQFSVEATIGYHADQTRAASNGNAKFERYPLEILGHFHLDENLHIGGGVRLVNNAHISSSGLLADPDLNRRFKPTTGVVAEAEYFFAPQVGIKLRAVSERYEPEDPSTRSLDGSHVGVFFTWYL